MADPLDPLSRLSAALVAVLDTAPAVVAVTGRARGNVVPWESGEANVPLPVLAYLVVTAQPALGTQWRAPVQLTASAVGTEPGVTPAKSAREQANALIAATLDALSATAFAALATPLDARREFDRDVLRTVEHDTDDGAARADLDVSILFTP